MLTSSVRSSVLHGPFRTAGCSAAAALDLHSANAVLADITNHAHALRSCTGGKTEDFMAAAKLFHSAGQQVTVPTYLVPATQKVPPHAW